jgi:predicted trehalose synthase
MFAGNVIAGWQLARSFVAAHQALASRDNDTAFLQAKQVTARFYADHILSKAPAARDSIVQGAQSVTAMALEAF